MDGLKGHLRTLLVFVAFWTVLCLLAWLGIATQVLTAWFWTVIAVLLATETYFIVCAVVWPRRWRGAGLRDAFAHLFPALCAAVTYVFGRWMVRHDEYSPMLLLGVLVLATVVAFMYFHIFAWPWLAWLLRLRKKPVLQWSDGTADEGKTTENPGA